MFAASPEQYGVPDVLRAESIALHELVADAIGEGAVEVRGTAVGMKDLEALQLVVAVHNQLCLVAVYPHQHHVLRALVHIAAHQLVGRSLCEKLALGDINTGLKMLTLSKARQNIKTISLHFPRPYITCHELAYSGTFPGNKLVLKLVAYFGTYPDILKPAC